MPRTRRGSGIAIIKKVTNGGGASSFTNTIFDRTVTTSGRPGEYGGYFTPLITPLMGTVDITFDGVLYQNVKDNSGYWGDTNFEEFPFFINLEAMSLRTTTEGDHTLKIEQTITPTPITFTVINQSTVGNVSFSLNMVDANSNVLNLFVDSETTVTGTALSYAEEYVPVFDPEGFTSEPSITVVNGTYNEGVFTLQDGAIITITD